MGILLALIVVFVVAVVCLLIVFMFSIKTCPGLFLFCFFFL